MFSILDDRSIFTKNELKARIRWLNKVIASREASGPTNAIAGFKRDLKITTDELDRRS